MGAKVYHFCQHCKQMVSASINDDVLKAHDQVADYNKYVDSVQAKRVVSKRCPKCTHPWKPVLLYIGWRSLRKAARANKVLDELLPKGDKRRNPGRFGFLNYKKLQQAKSKAKNTTPCYHERMKRISQRYK